MTPAQISKAAQRARGNVQALLDHRNAFTIGWCAAFVQRGRLHVVQRVHLAEGACRVLLNRQITVAIDWLNNVRASTGARGVFICVDERGYTVRLAGALYHVDPSNVRVQHAKGSAYEAAA